MQYDGIVKKMKRHIQYILGLTLLLLLITFAQFAQKAAAVPIDPAPSTSTTPTTTNTSATPTAPAPYSGFNGDCPADQETTCFFNKYLNPTIKVLSVIAGLAAVIGMMIGSIQYASSGGDPQKVSAGKGKIVKAIYGLVAFLFLYSALQFFSPGGIGTKNTPDTNRGGTTANQCAKPFLGLKPWFTYLPNDAFKPGTCDIEDFSLFGSTGDGSKSNIFPVLLAIADGLVRIAALVAVTYVITAGIKLTTSQGEPDKAKQARETIINALIGLVMAIVAAAVVSYIGGQLSK